MRDLTVVRVCRSAFSKWKKVCIRHVEELSLMESYQDVKREGTATFCTLNGWMDCTSHTFFTENMRRMFYTWLAAARKVRRKRVTLQEREYEMEKIRLENAWDKWRGRFQEEKLLPLVGVYPLCAYPRRTMWETGLTIDGRY
jgi:protein SFI1